MAYASILSVSCQPFRLTMDEPRRPEWPVYLGGPARTQSSEAQLSPPLKQLWRKRLAAGITQGVALRDGVLAVPTTRGEVFFLDTARGKELGKIKAPKTSVTVVWPFPNRLVVACGTGRATLSCYDLQRGQRLWHYAAGPVDAEPLPVADTLFVISTYGRVLALAVETGAVLWEAEVPSQVHSSPCAAGPYLIFGTDRGEVLALHRRDGRVAWRAGFRASVFATPVAGDTLVFVASTDSTFGALIARTGELRWSRREAGRIVQPAAVAPSMPAVIYAANDHSVSCARYSDGVLLWRARLNAPASTAPLILGSFVWIGGLDRRLYCLDLHSGRMVWSEKLRGIPRTLVPAKDALFVATEDYHLYCLHSEGETNP